MQMNTSTFTMPEVLSRLQKHFIGGDSFFDLSFDNGGFPPYNVEKVAPDRYVLTLALAGYKREDISVVIEGSKIFIQGTKQPKQNSDTIMIHQGIAERDFSREFRLMQNASVKSADFKDGLLSIEIAYEIPEILKPKKIEIG